MNQNEIEKERLIGKYIMAINYIKEQNERDRRYPRTINYYEEIARWMECDAEEVRKLDNVCNRLCINGMSWNISLREKGHYVTLNEAKNMLITLLAERIQEILAKYEYPFDVIKHAMPVKLKDDTKAICEENIENMFIIGVHSKEICEICKALYERDVIETNVDASR